MEKYGFMFARGPVHNILDAEENSSIPPDDIHQYDITATNLEEAIEIVRDIIDREITQAATSTGIAFVALGIFSGDTLLHDLSNDDWNRYYPPGSKEVHALNKLLNSNDSDAIDGTWRELNEGE